ncbi:MAG: AAA family ATPase [Thermoleophilia bacterium]|nr:AAA family ATPase [Thermoleophilia bacterium]
MAVLATKLHVPKPRPGLVARPRLRDRLDAPDVEAARLILVSAPAGSGKTTLLSQWFASRDATPRGSVAWVSVDGDDNDVRRFLAHVIAALRTTGADVGGDARAAMEAGGAAPVPFLLTSLVNDLDTVADPLVLVLDDYHEITAPEVHESLRFLLEHLPGRMRIAMTTRSDPPLPLARMRSTGAMVELRAADLRFTPDEAESLLNGVMGLGVSREHVDALGGRTEGWAAGLQLAALSIRGRADVGRFVDEFAGSHRFVLDYLIEEVLDRQPADVREFLLRTSVLGAMNASLCEAVTGRDDAREVLRALERDNVFVVALDDRREWWRYHHLFADTLRSRLRDADPGGTADLHRAAARWHAVRGALPEAIAHSAAAGDGERTADLVELALPGLRAHRRDDDIRRHVRALPDELVRARPLLAVFMAWSRLAEGDLDGVEAWLAETERRLAHPEDVDADLRTPLEAECAARDREIRQVPAMVAVYRACVAQARGDVPGTVAHARRALGLAGPDDHFPRGAAAGFLGLAAWASGDLPSAVDVFGEAVASLRAAGGIADALGATVVLADMWSGLGRPDESRRILERALHEAEGHPVPLSTTGDLHVALADVLREHGELTAAVAHMDAARDLGDAASLPENRHRLHLADAGILRARGDLGGALAAVDRAEAAYQPGFFPDRRPVPAVRARLRIAAGDLAAAEAWARTADIEVTDPPAHPAEFAQLTLARVRLAAYRAGAGSALNGVADMLDGIAAAAGAAGRTGSVIEARLLRALVLAAAGDDRAARETLAGALTAAVPAGHRRLFLDEGAPMEELLRRLVSAHHDEAAVARARRLLAAETPGDASSSTSGEGLSERELEVLRALATDLTGPQIAGRLYVSVNTLRTHSRHIFAKLGVNTRRAAVRRAAERGLL